MKRTAKKLFSLLLAVVLVAGMLPAGSIAFAAGETDTESIQFLGTGSYKNVDEITLYDTAWQNANWKYIDGSGNWTTRQMRQSSGSNANSLRLQAGALPDDASTYESWMAFKVKFTNANLTAGKYSLAMNGTAAANAATFWFAKADSEISDDNAEVYMTDENSLNELSTIAVSNVIGEDIAVTDLNSEYVLIIKVTGNVRFHISDFTFTRIGDLPTEDDSTEPLSGKVSVYVKSFVDGVADERGITADKGITAGFINSDVARGERITLTATGIDGKEFKYWQSASDIILSEDKTYTFDAYSNTAIFGVYESTADAEDGTEVTVRFFSGFGNFIQKVVDKKGTAFSVFADAVTDKNYRGYVFEKWMNADRNIENDTKINKNEVVVAQYADDPEENYNVTGIVNPGKYAYDKVVNAVSEDANFSYWKRNDKIVSYNPTYTFSVWGNTDVEEVCEGPQTAVPAVILDSDSGLYMVEYSLPENYTFIEAGILFSNSGTPTIDSCTSKASSKELKGLHGQFTARPAGNENIARGYVIYKDLEGDLMISYTD